MCEYVDETSIGIEGFFVDSDLVLQRRTFDWKGELVVQSYLFID